MRILLIDLLNIGDVLFTTPAVRALHRAYPEAEIDMLVSTNVRETILYNPHLHNVLTFDKHRGTAGDFLRLVRALRKRRYDFAVSFQSAARTSLLIALCGAKKKLGLVSSRFERLMSQAVMQRTDMHRVDSNVEILRELGIPVEDDGQGMEMHFDAQSQARAEKMWQEAGIADGAPVIGLNPGASVRIKRWTVEGFAELADRLYCIGLRTVFFGGPDDVPLANEIIAAMNTQTVSFAGKLNLLELAAMTPKCAVFVSTDTGPMHIAATQKIPITALFGPTNPAEFGPYLVPHIVCKSDAPCKGCQDGSSNPASHICFTSIRSDDVYEAVMKMLKR